MDEEYNGWPNKPTWLAFTHITDDEESLTHVRDLFALYNNPLAQAVALRNWVKDHTFADAYSSLVPKGLMYLASDLYDWVLAQVDWEYLAKHLREENP